MKSLFHAYTAIFLLMYNLDTMAQHPYFYDLNDENGLPSNEVYQVTQDSVGYLWIGCDAGLYRYNGFEYKAYRNPMQNSRSVSNLHFDKNGGLWCRNFSGQLFKVIDDSMYLICDYSAEANRFQITFTDDGFWKIDSAALTKYNLKGEILNKYPSVWGSYQFNRGVELAFYRQQLWLEWPGRGLFRFDSLSGNLILVLPAQNEGNLLNFRFLKNDNKLYLLRQDNQGTILVYNIEDNEPFITGSIINRGQARIFFSYTDKDKNLWLCTSKGVWLTEISDKNQLPRDILFGENKISSMLHDREGMYWFSDLQYGIHVMPDMNVLHFYAANSSLTDADLISMCRMPGQKLALGTFSGKLVIFNPADNSFYFPYEVNRVPGITVKDIECFGDNLFIARGKLWVYNFRKNTAHDFAQLSNARDLIILNDTLFSIHPEYVMKTCIWDLLENRSVKPQIISSLGGRKLAAVSSTGKLYLALDNGLHCYENGSLYPITDNAIPVYAFTIIADSFHLWAGTHAQGLLKISGNKIVNRYLVDKNLNDNSIKVLGLNDHFITVFTNSNIFRIHRVSGKIQMYPTHMGINSKDVYETISIGFSEFLATRKGLVKYVNQKTRQKLI